MSDSIEHFVDIPEQPCEYRQLQRRIAQVITEPRSTIKWRGRPGREVPFISGAEPDSDCSRCGKPLEEGRIEA